MDHATGLTVEQQYQLQKMIDSIKMKDRGDPAIEPDKILSYEEIQELIDGCYQNDKPWLGLMVEFLAYSGLRISEMLGIMKTDITKKPDHYKIQIRGKGDQPGSILINPDIVDRVKKHFGGGPYLFASRITDHYNRSYVSINIKRMAKRVLGRDDVSAHTLRHSAGTYFYQKTGDLRMTQKFLRHKSISTTARFYEHSKLSFDDVQNVFG
jgi:integrase